MSTITSLGFSIYSSYNNKGIKGAEKDVTSLGSKVGGMAKSIGSIALKAAAPIALIAAESIRSAVKFESSMKKIQTQAGGSAKDVKTLSKQVLSLAPSTQQGPEKLSEALYHLKSVGMDNVDAMKSLKVASDLAAVGGTDLESTTNALAGAWRTGIKGAQTFGQSAATVNAIIGAGNMTMEDMVAALGTGILPTAKTFGLTFNSVGAALAVFTDEGVGAASAATRLRMTISLLGAPSSHAEDQLKSIGLTGTMLANAMRSKGGLVAAVGLLKTHMEQMGLTATQQAQLLSKAFGGGKSSSAIMSLVNNFDVLEKKQNQVNASMSKYGPAVAAQRKTAQAQFNLLKSAAETMSIELGDKLLPPVTAFAEWIVNTGIPAASKFKDIIGDMIPVDTIKTKIGQVENLLTSAFKNSFANKLIQSTGIDKAVESLSPAPKTTHYESFHLPAMVKRGKTSVSLTETSKLTQRLAQSPRAVREFSSAAAAKSRTLQGTSKTNPNATMQTGENLSLTQAKKLTNAKGPSAQNQLSKMITSGLKGLDAKTIGKILGNILGVAFTYALTGISGIGKLIIDMAKKIDWVNVGKSIGGNAIGFALGFLASLGTDLFSASFWKKHWLDAIIGVLSLVGIGKIAGPLAKIFEHVPILKLIAPFLKSIGEIGKPFSKAFDIIWKPLKKAFADGFEKEIPEAKGALGKFIGAIRKQIDGWGATIYLKALYAIEAVGRAMGSGTAKALIALGKFFKNIVGAFPAAVILMATAGKSLSEGLLNGIASLFVGIGKWIDKHVFTPFIDNIDSLFEMHSPSKIMFTRGMFIIAGFLNGIINALVGVGKWINKNIFHPIMSGIDSAFGIAKGAARSTREIGQYLIGGLKNGVTSGLSGIGKWINKNIYSPIHGAIVSSFGVVKGTSSRLRDIGGDLISGLKNGIDSALSSPLKWVKAHLYTPIVNAVDTLFGINSPSTVFHEKGGHMLTGLMNGLMQLHPTKIIDKIFGSLPEALEALVNKGIVKISALPKKALSALKSLGGDIFGGGGGGNQGFDAAAAGKAQAFAKSILGNYGWGTKEFGPLKSLWNQESGWNYQALNKSSGAYGIPQSLPASKMASAGKDWRTNYKTQILWGLNYIHDRYGSPAEAWSHEGTHNWYANGTPGASRGLAWVGERGPELMQMNGGEKITANNDLPLGGEVHNHYDLRGAIISSKRDFEDMVVAANRNINRKGRAA